MSLQSRRPHVRLVPLCPQEDFDEALFSGGALTLRELLRRAPALSTEPLDGALMDRPVDRLIINRVEADVGQALYRPPGLRVDTPEDGRFETTREPLIRKLYLEGPDSVRFEA